jgi:uncharacterized protein YggE
MYNTTTLRLLSLLVLLIFAPPFLAAQDDIPEDNSITVYGFAEQAVEPDEVKFLLLLETKDLNLDSARARNEKLWDDLRALTREMKIDQKQIMVDLLHIEPEYLRKSPEYSIARNKFYGSEESELQNYYAVRRVSLKLRDLPRYTDFLARVLKLGIMLGGSPEFQFSGIEAVREKVRLQATGNARKKAESMAGELGKKVGDPLSITEGMVGLRESFYRMMGSRGEGDEAYSMSNSEPGQITVAMNVNVVFMLK